jgi:hypothetical protein
MLSLSPLRSISSMAVLLTVRWGLSGPSFVEVWYHTSCDSQLVPVPALPLTAHVIGWSTLQWHDESHYHGLWAVDFFSSCYRSGTYFPGVSSYSPLRSHRDEVLGRDFLVCSSRSGAPRAFFPGSVWPPVLQSQNFHLWNFSRNRTGNL